MRTISDTRVITFDVGENQRPIQRACRPGEFRPTTAEVHLDVATGDVVYVKVRGPVINHGAQIAAWIWYRGPRWPPDGVPDVAAAAVDAARQRSSL